MNKTVAAIVLVAAMLATTLSWAEDKITEITELQTLRNAARSDKRAFVTSMLQLTPAEAKKFWPLYDAYQRDLDMDVRRRTLALEGMIAWDKPVSDRYARIIANELIAADEAEIKSRRTLHNRVLRAIPTKKAARYLQLESKMRAIQAYDIATTIPLVR